MPKSTMQFPTLYQKSSTGAMKQWNIWVEDNQIFVEYGQVDGKLQLTSDTIKAGKNIGKVNSTTPHLQACAEAQSKWEHRIKRGYVANVARADIGEDDREGGFFPMLASKYRDQGHKIKYPCYVQRKLDGGRCVAIGSNGKFELWTRSRERITSMPHIVAALEKLLPSGDHRIDGELYNHEWHKKYGDKAFDMVMHAMRTEEPTPESAEIEYHVFDQYTNDTDGFLTRYTQLITKLATCILPIVLVEAILIKDEDEAIDLFEAWLLEKYEGLMFRNIDGAYVSHHSKRSKDLQKLKKFDDGEFRIIGMEEGRGKLQGHVGKFICLCNGQEFRAKPKGKGITDKLREYFLDHSLWEGRMLQVQYQGFSGRNGVPRFPVGIRLRDKIL